MSRSRPPLSAARTRERRMTYRAALKQFNELLSAAEAASTASRPLLLYYAASQVGTAITAALGRNHEVVRAHGLALERAEKPLLERMISPKKQGAFATLQDCFEVSKSPGAMTIGEIWSSLP